MSAFWDGTKKQEEVITSLANNHHQFISRISGLGKVTSSPTLFGSLKNLDLRPWLLQLLHLGMTISVLPMTDSHHDLPGLAKKEAKS